MCRQWKQPLAQVESLGQDKPGEPNIIILWFSGMDVTCTAAYQSLRVPDWDYRGSAQGAIHTCHLLPGNRGGRENRGGPYRQVFSHGHLSHLSWWEHGLTLLPCVRQPLDGMFCLVSEQLSAQYGAVKMLHSRVRLVLDYLKAVQSGKHVPLIKVWPTYCLVCACSDELPCNRQILREASALCNQLPVLDKAVFNKDFHSVSSPSTGIEME